MQMLLLSMKRSYLLAVLLLAIALPAIAQGNNDPVAWWKFDEGSGNIAADSISGIHDPILNNHKWVKGVSGSGLKFDGFTTVIERAPKDVPDLRKGFTIEAWIAMQSYPWNWVALVDNDHDRQSGYFFGIDAEGRLGLQLSVWGNWEVCRSQVRVPLKRWTHVAAVYDPSAGIRLYIDGKFAGSLPVIGNLDPAKDTVLRIGRNIQNLPPTSLVRPKASFPALYSFDGIIDELKIYNRSLTSAQITQEFQPSLADTPPELTARRWPVFPLKSDRLKASYTELKLYPEWDALWRSGPYSDVVVSFKDLPVHYVFWRGANFGPSIVTENNIWFSDQSFEASTKVGTAEHMNDKHNMHAYISILHSSDARVVLHWHYILVDVLGNISDIDPATGWGDRADEYFYIYPDGVAVRHGIIHGTRKKYSFTEPTVLLEPGKKPEDYVSLDAATVANANGESRTYSWDPVPPPFPFPGQPAGSNIAIVNSKSTYKPFYIYQPGTELGPYGWPPENREHYSHFPVWDHWPVNQIPSDGRFELFPDHFGSAAIMSPNPNGAWVDGPGQTKSATFLFGLTNTSVKDLAALDRSWLHPPALQVDGDRFRSTYESTQRAYLLQRTAAPNPSGKEKLAFTVEASEASPAVNPAFVVQNWGDSPISLSINGSPVRKEDFQVGFEGKLSGTDLVLWIKRTSTSPFRVSILANKQLP